jgi:hypothetical protein
MNRTRTFLIALFAALILTAAAGIGFAVFHTAAAGAVSSAADPPALKGYEVGIVGNTSTFVGLIPPTQVWKAAITHDPLDTQPNSVTDITGGSFVVGAALSFNWPSGWAVAPQLLSLGISSGEIVAGPSGGGKGSCTQVFEISGDLLPAGTFVGELKHYGEKVNGSCSADFASVTVTVSTP